jgi:hypothetical protein
MRRSRTRHVFDRARINLKHLLVRKHQRAERPVLRRRGSHAARWPARTGTSRFLRQPSSPGASCRGDDVPANPVNAGLLGPAAVVSRPDGEPYPIEQSGTRHAVRKGHPAGRLVGVGRLRHEGPVCQHRAARLRSIWFLNRPADRQPWQFQQHRQGHRVPSTATRSEQPLIQPTKPAGSAA